jgi:sec-independent protein translocase protein TatB
VGFGEILVILIIALVVLGPEKLPKLAADIGRWTGRARAMARQLRVQLDDEIHLAELRREMEKHANLSPAPAPVDTAQPTAAPTAEPSIQATVAPPDTGAAPPAAGVTPFGIGAPVTAADGAAHNPTPSAPTASATPGAPPAEPPASATPSPDVRA